MLTREQLLALAAVIREETEQGLNTAQRVGHLLYEIASSLLIKTQDDQTENRLTADELEAVERLIVVGTQLVGQGNNTLGNIISQIHGSQVVDGSQTVKGVQTNEGSTYFGPEFVSGLFGRGGKIASDGAAELDSLVLRKFLEAPEYRLNRTTSVAGNLMQSWCNGIIESVTPLTESTGFFTLKLENGEAGSCQAGDICMGIFHYGLSDAAENSDDLKGNVTVAGFTTTYFSVDQTRGTKNSIVYYTLRPHVNPDTHEVTGYYPHPRAFMKFSGYGNFTNTARQSAIILSHSYIRFVREVDNWEFDFRNIAMQIGELDGLHEAYRSEGCPEMTGYSAYLRNIYFSGKIEQLSDDAIESIRDKLKVYSIYVTEHVSVITVDDVGNVIGGLWKEEVDDGGNAIRTYRIHSTITVRNLNDVLTIAAPGVRASAGKYQLYLQPHGCTAFIEDSTLYVTAIENVKDGVAGSPDDVNFDYDRMRLTESCSVDILIDCEGVGTITKRFPITIEHVSQPFVSADISNEFSGVSWNTRTQSYVGLPIEIGMKMWHNNEILDIENVGDISVLPAIQGMTVAKSIVTDASGAKTALIRITALPANLPLVTNLNITCAASYSGISYERTLVHTINKSVDTNVYSLLPSVDEVLRDPNLGTFSANTVNCSVICDSSDDKHYAVAYADFATHGLVLCWRKYYSDGTQDQNETVYNNNAISVESTMSKIRFSLYGRLANGNPDTSVLHDTEEIPVIAHGLNGSSGSTPIAKYKWFAQSAGVTLTAQEKASALTSWSDTAPARPNDGWYLWMTQNTRDGSGNIGQWSDPVRISGDNGSAGEDSKEREWIYRCNNNTGYDGTAGTAGGQAVSGNDRFTTDGFVPTNWTDHPTGINAHGDTEYASWRDFDKSTQQWGAFNIPVVWSHYGERGMDGDGMEYAFVRTQSETAPTITNSNDTYDGKTYTDDEYLPMTSAGRATDDPSGVNATYKYEWVIKRSKSAAVDGVRTWERYSGTMSLWAKYSVDGDSQIAVYAWNRSASTAPSISGTDNPPSGWYVAPPNRPGNGYFLWMSTSVRHPDGSIDAWSTPVRISGDTGSAGEDAADREWIYFRSSEASYGTAPASITTDRNGVSRSASYIASHDDFVPQGWSDNPQGVDSTNAFEYASFRDKERGASTWGAFQTPILWSHFGQRGMDGDGVEYVFVKTQTDTPPTITNNNDWSETVNGSTVQHSYTDDEYLPMTSAGRATDDPQGTDSTYKYEWVAKRTKGEAVNGVRAWNPYAVGPMSLWANFSEDGEDGMSQPSYMRTQEAWSNAEAVASSSTEPTPNGGWSDNTPSNPNNYAYLWRRSCQMVLNTSTRQYAQSGGWTYVRLSGTNGTSINPKGTVIAVAASSGSLPSSGVSTGDLAIVVGDSILFRYSGGWSHVSAASSDGDCYVISESCTYGGEDVKGHMFMFSTEASQWIDLGKFKGDSGLTYYTHIAWADDVTIVNNVATAVSGFSVGIGTDGEAKPWMGICIDLNASDPSTFSSYKWKYLKGERGADGTDREWIYKRSNSSTAPNIPASSGTGTVGGVSTPYSNTVDDWVPSGWSDNPQGVDESNKYEYACWRDKAGGSDTWGAFQGANGKAILWSHYGERGTDGDGVEYAFVRTSLNIAPEVFTPAASYTDSEGRGTLEDEFLPFVKVPDSCDLSGNTAQSKNGGYSHVECTDDPQGVNNQWPYEWVLKRSKASAVNGVRAWNQYAGSMSLWANWSESPYMLDLTNEQSFVNCDENGNVLAGAVYESTGVMLFRGMQQAFSEFNILVTPTNISCNGHSSAFTIDGASATLINGAILLTPSAITSNMAEISVVATHKSYPGLVLSASYKINKNISGGVGVNAVMYSIVPSLNVIHKNNDGTFRDTVLSVVVNKTDGTDVSPLATAAMLSAEGLVLTYQGSHSSEQTVSDPSNLSTAAICGTALFTKLFLRKAGANTLLDSERINVVSDGKTTPLYFIETEPDSVTIPSNSTAATWSGYIDFYKKEGDEEPEGYFAYSRIFVRKLDGTRRTASSIVNVRGFGSRSSNAPYTIPVTTDDDVIEVYIRDTTITSDIFSNYLAKKEIAIYKKGDKGDAGDDADYHEIRVVGTNYNSSTEYAHLEIDGESPTGDVSSRGLSVAIIDAASATVDRWRSFDVYADSLNSDTTQTDNMLNYIRTYGVEGKIVCILSYDAVHILDRVYALLAVQYGLGQNIVVSQRRRSIAIICQKGMSPGQAVCVQSESGDAVAKTSVAGGLLVTMGNDRIPIGQNLLQGSDFERMSNWSKKVGTIQREVYEGSNAYLVASPESGYSDVLEQVLSRINSGVLQPGTWYTLSFVAKGGQVTSYVYPRAVDVIEKAYVDGEEVSPSDDLNKTWTPDSMYGVHTITFKTRPKCTWRGTFSFSTSYNRQDIVSVQFGTHSAYSSGTSYSVGDIVEYNGGYYYSKTGSNSNHTPSSSSSYWIPLGSLDESAFNRLHYFVSQKDSNSGRSFMDTTYWRECTVDSTTMGTGFQKFAEAINLLFRKHSGQTDTYIAKPKLEEGCYATGWEASKKDKVGLTGCHERVFEVFTPGQTYYNEEGDFKEGIRYVDFYAKEDSSVASGYRVYMCLETHVAASTFAEDIGYWDAVDVNAASAFFKYLIAKNANIKMLSSAQIIISDANGTIVAGLANSTVPLWIGGSVPDTAPFRVTRAGKLYATGAEISGKITATSGRIAGFSISGNGLTNSDDNGNFTNDAYIILRNDAHNSFVGIGPNVLPVYASGRALGRFEIEDQQDWFGSGYNIALLLSAKNATYNNFAFKGTGNGILSGWIGGYLFSKCALTTANTIYDGSITLKTNNCWIVTSSVSGAGVALPRLSAVRQALGIGSSTAFCVMLTIVSDLGSSEFSIYGRNKIQSSSSTYPWNTDDLPLMTNWNGSKYDSLTMGNGDSAVFLLIYDPDRTATISDFTTKYTARIINRQD